MASAYRDSAGVERPTQWERAHGSTHFDQMRGTVQAIFESPHGRGVATINVSEIGRTLEVTPDGTVRRRRHG